MMRLVDPSRMVAPALAIVSTLLAIGVSVFFNVHDTNTYSPLWKLSEEHLVPFTVPNIAACIYWCDTPSGPIGC